MGDLGARWDGAVATIGVRSPAAERVELCVIDRQGAHEWRTDLAAADDEPGEWRLTTDRLTPGDRYGFRVHGPHADPAALLLDPAALAVSGTIDWERVEFGTGRDTGPHVPWSVLVNTAFDWGHDRRPPAQQPDALVYEANVRGLTARHPGVAEGLRGTYRGIAEPAVLQHLVDLGVTALELLPVQQFVTGRAQWQMGLRNLWGYDPVAWFAPHNGYATGDRGEQVGEFQTMVAALHEAGIAVILDVVFNHSGEYDRSGPTLAFRGLDDTGWYRHHADGSYEDTTGCRNTIDLRPTPNRALVLDALRSWVEVFHVDGFRFDLATTLLRGDHGVDLASPFLAEVAADPVLADRWLIAEAWDAAADGYRVGEFPAPWAEWNDRFRDDVRDRWSRATVTRQGLATRLAGSSDLFAPDRRPSASINFVTAHDGFTLADLVAYEQPRNDANGEGGADGSRHNRAWNCGVEGPTDDPVVLALRARQQRNLLATLLLARGTPMLVAGDELGRTQQGNNNAWCQDNAVSYLDWESADGNLLAFTRRAMALRRDRPELHDDRWFAESEVRWLEPDGADIDGAGWPRTDEAVLVLAHPDLLIVVNASDHDRAVTLPPGEWSVALDSTTSDGSAASGDGSVADAVNSAGRSVLVLVRQG